MMRSMSSGAQSGVGERRARRRRAERRGGLALAGDIALRDAGALHDPFVGGVDALFQLGIGHATLRQS